MPAETSFDFIKFLTNFLTRDNITLAIALLGAYGTVSVYIKQRLKLSVTFLGRSNFSGQTSLELQIENKSSIPVSITQIRLRVGQDEVAVSRRPYLVIPGHPNTRNPHLAEDTYSFQFPIRLESFEATSGYISLPPKVRILDEGTEKIPLTPVTLIIVTTRGVQEQSLPELPVRYQEG